MYTTEIIVFELVCVVKRKHFFSQQLAYRYVVCSRNYRLLHERGGRRSTIQLDGPQWRRASFINQKTPLLFTHKKMPDTLGIDGFKSRRYFFITSQPFCGDLWEKSIAF